MVLAASCSPKVETRGYIKNADWQQNVVVGKTTKDEVMNQFGSPSAQSNFGDETWYYITIRQEATAFFRPENTEQDVVKLTFDRSGVLSAIKAYNKDNAQDFEMVKRTTPTEGHSVTAIEQFLGNIGRFNNSSGGSLAPGRQPRR